MTTMGSATFPFKIDDLKAWIVHRKDGTVTRFVMVTAPTSSGTSSSTGTTDLARLPGTSTTSTVASRVTSGYGSFCKHKPSPTNKVASFDRDGEELAFWVGSINGAKETTHPLDFIIDCADIFNIWSHSDLLAGDAKLMELLAPFTDEGESARLLKIDWDDRMAPKVHPEFWTKLNTELHGNVMTCCVGGHGRSGTSFVCLLLNNAPDYDALDAIIHLRAVHCPRAIESLVQHQYIDRVAEFLGRMQNASKASQITDYKAAFMASTRPTAIATRKKLGWE